MAGNTVVSFLSGWASKSRVQAPSGGAVLAVCRWFPPRVGGVERYLGQLYTALTSQDVTAIAPPEGDWQTHDAHVVRPKILRAGSGRSNGKRVVLPLYAAAMRALATGEYSQIHCGHLILGVIGLVGRLRYGLPYIVFVYGSELTRDRYRRLRGLVMRHAAFVVTISQSSADLVSAFGVQKARIRIIHPPVDPARFSLRDASAARRQLGLPTDSPLLLVVARLDSTAQHKGVDTALGALAVLRAQIPHVRLVVVGSGDDAARLRGHARSLGIEEAVVFVGAVSDEDLPAYYAAADVFLLPNRRARMRGGYSVEGFGIVLLEAAASGVPCVAWSGGGAADAVWHRRTGLLLDEISPESVADAVRVLLEDGPLRAEMGRAARRWAVERFSPEAAASELSDVISEVRSQGTRANR